MNCFEFRREAGTEPRGGDPGFREHAANCPGCATWLEGIREIDRRIVAAARLAPPPDLRQRVLLRRALRTRTRGPAVPLAIAATVLLAIAVIMTLRPPAPLEQAQTAVLAPALLAHVGVPHARRDGESPQRSLSRVLDQMDLPGGAPDGLLAAERCRVDDQWAAHVVVTGAVGDIDILLLPRLTIGSRTSVRSEISDMLLLPCPLGTVAIVGRPGESLAEVERRLRNTTSWL